jgi:ketosteroid isomerase-like protein
MWGRWRWARHRNEAVVRRLFDAFGRGDIPAAMELFAEDVVFRSPVTHTRHETLGWARPRRGRREVLQFFSELAGAVAPEPFEVLGMISKGDTVVVEGRNSGTVRSTGTRFTHDWVMVFSLRDGKITRNDHYYDSADLLAAYH